jgi:hypothetical protein
MRDSRCNSRARLQPVVYGHNGYERTRALISTDLPATGYAIAAESSADSVQKRTSENRTCL